MLKSSNREYNIWSHLVICLKLQTSFKTFYSSKLDNLMDLSILCFIGFNKDIFTDLDPTTAKSVLSDIPPVIGYEVFQDLVNFLRNDTGLSRRNPERDINIFLLRVWEDLNDNMIYHHPCINDPRRRLVGNVVDQYRKILRERIF